MIMTGGNGDDGTRTIPDGVKVDPGLHVERRLHAEVPSRPGG
jgi:hypothetical protein